MVSPAGDTTFHTVALLLAVTERYDFETSFVHLTGRCAGAVDAPVPALRRGPRGLRGGSLVQLQGDAVRNTEEGDDTAAGTRPPRRQPTAPHEHAPDKHVGTDGQGGPPARLVQVGHRGAQAQPADVVDWPQPDADRRIRRVQVGGHRLQVGKVASRLQQQDRPARILTEPGSEHRTGGARPDDQHSEPIIQ